MRNVLELLTEATLAGSRPPPGYGLTAHEPRCIEGRPSTANRLIHLWVVLRAVLIVFATSAALMAQMDPREIVRRSIITWDRSSKTGRNYSYTERHEQRQLDSNGLLKSEQMDLFHIIFVNGDPFDKLVEHNRAPLTLVEERKQLEKLLKRQDETGADRGTRLAKEKDDRAFVNEVVEAFTFKLIGEDVIDGRPAYILDVTPRPGYVARSKRAKMFSNVAGRLWVDKQDFGWPKANGHVIEPFFIGFVVARVQRGSQIEFTQTRVADGVWLPKHVGIKAHAKVLFIMSHDVDEVITFSDYQEAERAAMMSLVSRSRGPRAQ